MITILISQDLWKIVEEIYEENEKVEVEESNKQDMKGNRKKDN